jgi:hypothetical protein
VGLVLGELVEKYWEIGHINASMMHKVCLFTRYYSPSPPPPEMMRSDEAEIALETWKARKAELRRRAATLPR